MSCLACQQKVNHIDYKQTDILRKYVSGQFKVFSSDRTGLCNRHLRMLANAVKLAWYMALLPYTKALTRKM